MKYSWVLIWSPLYLLLVSFFGNRFGFLQGGFLFLESFFVLGCTGFNDLATTFRFVSVLFGFIELKKYFLVSGKIYGFLSWDDMTSSVRQNISRHLFQTGLTVYHPSKSRVKLRWNWDERTLVMDEFNFSVTESSSSSIWRIFLLQLVTSDSASEAFFSAAFNSSWT